MTDTELSAICARCEAATPGPWVFDDRPFSYGLGIVGHNGEKVMDDGSAGGEYAETTTIENMRFICAAKADIPALLAHIEAQRATLAKAEADKAELVEALEEMVSVAEIIAGFANIPANANGPLIKSRAALAKVKEASCQKD